MKMKETIECVANFPTRRGICAHCVCVFGVVTTQQPQFPTASGPISVNRRVARASDLSSLERRITLDAPGKVPQGQPNANTLPRRVDLCAHSGAGGSEPGARSHACLMQNHLWGKVARGFWGWGLQISPQSIFFPILCNQAEEYV